MTARGTVVVVLLVSWFLGVDPTMLLQNVPLDSTPVPGGAEPAPTSGRAYT